MTSSEGGHLGKGEGSRGMGIDRAWGMWEARGPVEAAGLAGWQERSRPDDEIRDISLVSRGSRGRDRRRPRSGGLWKAEGEGNRCERSGRGMRSKRAWSGDRSKRDAFLLHRCQCRE